MNNDQFLSLIVLTVVCGLVIGFGVHIGFVIFFRGMCKRWPNIVLFLKTFISVVSTMAMVGFFMDNRFLN
jgi:hypothetical protein